MNIRTLVLPLLLLTASCNTNQQLQNELTRTRDELDYIRKERDNLLAAQNEQFESYEKIREEYVNSQFELRQERDSIFRELQACRKLSSSAGRYKRENESLKKWIRVLADGYGPGVWEWSVDADNPVFGYRPTDSSLEGLVAALNLYFTEVNNPLVIMKKAEGNTVYVGTSDDRKVTAQMGSYGANAYAMRVLYTLTSDPNINCVFFDIEEGDHLAPGKRCR